MNQHCTGRQANQSVQWGFNSLEFYISKWLPKWSEDTCPMALLCSTSSYPQLSAKFFLPRCYWRDWANPVAISLSTPGWCNFPGQQLHLATAPCQVTEWGFFVIWVESLVSGMCGWFLLGHPGCTRVYVNIYIYMQICTCTIAVFCCPMLLYN